MAAIAEQHTTRHLRWTAQLIVVTDNGGDAVDRTIAGGALTKAADLGGGTSPVGIVEGPTVARRTVHVVQRVRQRRDRAVHDRASNSRVTEPERLAAMDLLGSERDPEVALDECGQPYRPYPRTVACEADDLVCATSNDRSRLRCLPDPSRRVMPGLHGDLDGFVVGEGSDRRAVDGDRPCSFEPIPRPTP